MAIASKFPEGLDVQVDAAVEKAVALVFSEGLTPIEAVRQLWASLKLTMGAKECLAQDGLAGRVNGRLGKDRSLPATPSPEQAEPFEGSWPRRTPPMPDTIADLLSNFRIDSVLRDVYEDPNGYMKPQGLFDVDELEWLDNQCRKEASGWLTRSNIASALRKLCLERGVRRPVELQQVDVLGVEEMRR